jgi:UDPglucose--hexose-1-phosphate uridylyltransferase
VKAPPRDHARGPAASAHGPEEQDPAFGKDHAQADRMSELRQDRTTGTWVIIAPRRGQRPQRRGPGPAPASRPRFDPACPFCPGHEAMLPGIIAETPADAVPGWSVRVVPNKFPALQPTPESPAGGDHQTRVGYGFHEVVIESPWHDADLVTMVAAERNVVVGSYRLRSQVLLAQPDIESVVVFCNKGPKAGASLSHPHAQIIALALVPPRLNAMSEAGRRYHQEQGRCATCDELAIERQNGVRVVDENALFLAMVPFAAEHACELWILPKRHQASFTALNDTELGDFGAILGGSLRRLNAALDNPSYNFVIESAPKREIKAPHMHWRMRIVPGIATWGGFELGSGLPINPSSPEADAALLRSCVRPLVK